jgi:hypothetical protein
MRQYGLFAITFLLAWSELFGEMERRREQYLGDPGYFIAPAPYALAGIGSGVMLLGMANNIGGTQTDLMADVLTGDVGGYGFGVGDWYLIDRHLKFEVLRSQLDKASIQSYNTRGMDSKKEEYVLISVDTMTFTGLRATASFWEKMLEFYTMAYLGSFSLESIKDKDGNLILEASDISTQHSTFYILGFMADYTDDRLDPRRGVRLDASLDYSPPNGNEGADFYQSNYNLTAYLPFGKKSTLAFNYYRSDAHVITQGETDYDTLSQQMGLDCSLLADANERRDCESVVTTTQAANRYGTAASLGGYSRLRSYTQGRFSGAHTQFYGAEFRWNLTEERTPFDIWFMKDIRTGIQAAFFYEGGSVAEKVADLGKAEAHSYGAGLRMVTASGLIYRLDGATGEEGFEMTMMINYPWEVF